MAGFFSRETAATRNFQGKWQGAPQRTAFGALLAPNPGP
jgi:hypothetical protein